MSKSSWEADDQLKAKKAPLFKAPPSPSELKRVEEMYTKEEWHSLVYEAAEKNLDRHLETDLREEAPADFDELMDLTLQTDFADIGSVCTGVSGIPERPRSRLNFPAERNARSSPSCPSWVAPKKAYSANRGPHYGAESTAQSTAKPASSSSGKTAEGFYHL